MDFYKDFDNNLSSLIDSVKSVLYSRHNDIFERIDFYNDDIYMEPLLYTYLNQDDDEWLDCIIYGYESVRKESVKVYSNNEGVVYIPNIGYFKTEKTDAQLFLKTRGEEYVLEYEDEFINYIFEPIIFTPLGVELLKYQHPILDMFFHSNGLPPISYVDKRFYTEYLEHINNAFSLMREGNENHFNLLKKTLKKIMLFSSTDLNSFAVMQAHNMIFLNINPWDNEMFYVDHLSHEGAHVTFNTITYESKSTLFKYHYDTNFSDVTGDATEPSSIYLRFHGLFTFYEITKSLQSCMLNSSLSARSIHEAKGRFAFQLQRFGNSLKSFENLDIFEEEGRKWYEFFLKKYTDLNDKFGNMIYKYDLIMPSYDFNSKVFEEKNPITD